MYIKIHLKKFIQIREQLDRIQFRLVEEPDLFNYFPIARVEQVGSQLSQGY